MERDHGHRGHDDHQADDEQGEPEKMEGIVVLGGEHDRHLVTAGGENRQQRRDSTVDGEQAELRRRIEPSQDRREEDRDQVGDRGAGHQREHAAREGPGDEEALERASWSGPGASRRHGGFLGGQRRGFAALVRTQVNCHGAGRLNPFRWPRFRGEGDGGGAWAATAQATPARARTRTPGKVQDPQRAGTMSRNA